MATAIDTLSSASRSHPRSHSVYDPKEHVPIEFIRSFPSSIFSNKEIQDYAKMAVNLYSIFKNEETGGKLIHQNLESGKFGC